MRFSLGYVSEEEEILILSEQRAAHPLDQLRAIADEPAVSSLRAAVRETRISDEIKRYIVSLVSATRSAPGIAMGASPRASITLMKSAQALALYDGAEFVSPDHVYELAAPVIAHRLVLDSQARFSGLTAESALEELMKTVPAPR